MTTQDQKPSDSQMRAMIDQACEDLGRHGLQATDEAAQVVLNLIASASELGRMVRLRNEPSAEWVHDCEHWRMEGIACAKCNPASDEYVAHATEDRE